MHPANCNGVCGLTQTMDWEAGTELNKMIKVCNINLGDRPEEEI